MTCSHTKLREREGPVYPQKRDSGRGEYGKGREGLGEEQDREDGGLGYEHNLFTHKTEGGRRTCVQK